MKSVIVKSIILIILPFISLNLDAGKDQLFGYKVPDLQLQKQQACQASNYLKKIGTPNHRFDRRHPVKIQATRTSINQKILALLYGAMIINAELSNSILPKSKNQKNDKLRDKTTKPLPESKTNETRLAKNPNEIGTAHKTFFFGPILVSEEPISWPSTVHNLTNGVSSWPDSILFSPYVKEGSCINPRFTITKFALNPDRYVSFDLAGFPDNQSKTDFNLTAALLEARKICSERSQSHHIARETFNLLSQLRPTYNQNVNGTRCTIETYSPGKNYPDFIGNPFSYEGSCSVLRTDITPTKNIPTLTTMIQRMTDNFCTRPRTFVYSNSHCITSLREYDIASAVVFFDDSNFLNDFKWGKWGIMIPYDTLLKNSDEDIENILGHEIYHIKQYKLDHAECSATKNNMELEADIASVLITKNPCLAVWIEKFLWNDHVDSWEEFKPFTKDNKQAMLELINQYGCRRHPSNALRMSAILHIYEYYQQAKDLLEATQEQ